MKWIGISGSWRKINPEIDNLIRQTVREIILRGNGIVSGGALGVDYVALDQALKINPQASRIKIFIPAKLEIFQSHYLKRAKEGVITSQQAENLISQLAALKKINPTALVEDQNNLVLNQLTYYQRNSEIIEAADELIAFHVVSELSGGAGTLDTINKAKVKGIPVKIYHFNLKA
ncbi:MAG: hypothetical protein WC768_05635 [Patescibacteria group bacterium]|jgi:hypothetical protein